METEGGSWFSELSCVFPEPLFLFFLSLYSLSSLSESLNCNTVPLFIILFYFCCTSNTKNDGQSRKTLTGCVKSNLLSFTGFFINAGEKYVCLFSICRFDPHRMYNVLIFLLSISLSISQERNSIFHFFLLTVRLNLTSEIISASGTALRITQSQICPL